jgi:hypothetical protein
MRLLIGTENSRKDGQAGCSAEMGVERFKRQYDRPRQLAHLYRNLILCNSARLEYDGSPMTATLTRRRAPDTDQETWLIHYGDIHVGSIVMRAGVPADKDQWGWSVGFSPAADRGLRASGTAKSFDAARAAFDVAWQWLLPKFTEADFTEYRQHRAFDAWKRAMWDQGLKLPTQVADGRARCFCGAAIAIADVEEHVYSTHLEPVSD